VFNTAISDQLAVKLFGTNIEFDGYRPNRTTGNDIAERDYQNYGATFLWEPNDDFELLFTAEAFRDEGILDAFQANYNVPPGLIPAPPPGSPEGDFSGGFLTCILFGTCRTSLKTPSYAENDKDNHYSLDTDAYTLKMSYQLNSNITLVSITGYRDVEEYRIYDFDGSAAPVITIERWNEYDQLSQEFRIDGQWDTVTLTAGLYYFQNEFEQDWVTGDAFWSVLFGAFAADPVNWAGCQAGSIAPVWCDAGLPGGIPLGQNVTQILYETQETTSTAAYAQMDWRFADQWILTAGIRYTKETKDFIAGQAYLSNEARQRARAFPEYADLSQDWTDTSPKLGLTYEINEDSMAFITYSEGFHSGGFFGVNQNTRDFIRDQYDPELAEVWEVGYKSQHLDDRLRLNVTYFHNEFIDKQESFVGIDPDTKTVASVFSNAGSVIYQGWELEAQFVFNEYVRGFFNYGYLDAEYDEFDTDINPNDAVTIIEDATHLTPRNAPESVWGVGGTVTIPVGAAAIEIFAKYTKIDEVEASLLNLAQSQVDAREDVTASIGYYTENWSVSLFGRNLTDERFEVFVPIATLFAVGNVNRPRSYGVDFTYEF
jgi:iron complex outermembrane receptor protein